MAQRINGVTFEPLGQMDKSAITAATVVVEALAKAYVTGRDSAQFATNVREEARDELIAALGAMRIRRFVAGAYRVIRTLDRSRTLNLDKVRKLLGDKAEYFYKCYDTVPRYSINVMAHRVGELQDAAATIADGLADRKSERERKLRKGRVR